ncbi:hypothetical protein Tco_0597195 [Tanacetum coccineum]
MRTKRKLVPKSTVNGGTQGPGNGNAGLQNFNKGRGTRGPDDREWVLVPTSINVNVPGLETCLGVQEPMVGATFSSSESISHSGSRLPPAQASIRGVVEPDSRAASLGPPSGYRSVGKCEHSCKHCGALFWYEEQIEHSARYAHQKASFVENIRATKPMFRMTTLGSLCPEEGEWSRFLQLYIYDTDNEYELPTGDMLGAIVGPETEMDYDIIIKELSGYPQRVNKLHPSYMSLQFPLLFLYREDGYSKELNLVGGAGSSNADKRLTMKAYYVYFIHDRANCYNYFSTTGRLFQ